MEPFPERSTENDNRKEIIILSSIFGAICLIILCVSFSLYFGYTNLYKKQQASIATAQAQATVTAVYQATQVADYEFFDDFDNNVHGWDSGTQVNDYWSGNLSISDGAYVWEIEELHNDGFFSRRDWYANIAIEDFDLSVDAKLATPEAVSLCYAVVFRASSDISEGYYVFSVCDDQKYYVEYNSDVDGNDKLSSLTHSPIIRSGDWNTLAVSARGDHFILSINNVVVSEFTDTRLPKGYIYLMLDADDTIPGTIMFDNFGLQTR